jgi:sugar phosphate isomerase/epimerase
MDIFTFLEACRNINLDAASLHIRGLKETTPNYLKKLRRKYFDLGLTPGAIGVTTDFGSSQEKLPEELEKAREGIRVAMFLGAPTVRVFAGSAADESRREEAFRRAVEGLRRVAEEGAQAGMPISLQNHNHRALARTGSDVLRFLRDVNHPNLTVVLDTGQFAGSKGASEERPQELQEENLYESIQEVAPVARYVRAKIYELDSKGRERWIDYNRVFSILRSVHYHGLVDIVYEGKGDERVEVARAAEFLRPFLS